MRLQHKLIEALEGDRLFQTGLRMYDTCCTRESTLKRTLKRFKDVFYLECLRELVPLSRGDCHCQFH
jgi:hypothetical protein